MLSRLIARAVGWTATLFYDLESRGGPFPAGPVLVAANHPNSLLDPIVLFRAAGRPARPLAKAPLFGHPIIGPVLKALGGLPLYRRQDDPMLMHLNDHTFERAVEALRRGDAVQIYPEGRSHSEPGLAPLRTGAARIALRAESEAGWTLGLRIIPVGLTYTRKTRFRGRVCVIIGEPFQIAGYRQSFDVNPALTVRALTEEIARRLEALTLNFAESEDRELIEAAERLYVREKGWVDWRAREGLADRLPRLREFARGLAWLRAHEPERHTRLARAVRRYRRRLALLGAGDADVPPRYGALRVARFITRQGLVLGLGFPLGVLGGALWYPVYRLPRLALTLVRLDYEAVATYKLVTAVLATPLVYAFWLWVAWDFAGTPGVGVAAPVLPVLGLVALAWTGRWRRAQEDARLFLRVLLHPRQRDRLAAQRAALVAEFDAVARDLAASDAAAARSMPVAGA